MSSLTYQENTLTANAFHFEVNNSTSKRIGIIFLALILCLFATVTSAFGQATFDQDCRRANPTVHIGPSPQSAFPGNQLNFIVTFTNNDSAACPPSTFNAMATFPRVGFSHIPDCVRITLSKRESSARGVIIKAPGRACVGATTFRETAINETAFGFSGFADAVFNVVAIAPDCGRAAPTVNISPAFKEGTAGEQVLYSVTVTNNDNPRCGLSDFAITPALPSGLIAHTPKTFTLTQTRLSAITSANQQLSLTI